MNRNMILFSAMDKYPVDDATFVAIGCACGFRVHDCKIVLESRYGTHRHTMRDEHDWNTTLPRCEVERDSVRITVIGRQRNVELAVAKKLDVPSVITKQLNHSHHFERLIP